MILMLGDIHGNFANVKWQIKTRNLQNCFIIQVGDFGIGTNPHYANQILEDLDKFLGEYNVTMYAIRGNHDDPFYFKGDHIYNNLKLLPDYTQLEIDGHNILFVGGAVSVDRKISLAKMQQAASYGVNQPMYWYDEAFVLDKDKLKDVKDVDIVVTHTAPKWCVPDNRNGFGDFVMAFAFDDATLLEELTEERELLTQMFNILKENGNHIRKHYYGHFHRNDITINGYTEHILLGIGEMQIVDSMTEDEYNQIFNQ